MALNINDQQLAAVRERIDQANQKSHFVIFQSVEKATGKVLRLITDIESFRTIQEQHQADAAMVIIQDIVPITDDLARWAVAENMAAQQPNDAAVLEDLETYTNAVLTENHQAANTDDDQD
ncbi:hypothetical protein [Levilactobacillus namurensis]|uniref:Uncharacterized protein n=1 Tax=Levilactobacillus namurensis TaxID=380393 RepID=A0AAW8W292_9LACO|nr:hypothetical protein [Levilactobacillus namurensis]PTM21721.1 hypothetical protein DA798_08860 [Lactobacillus sp. PFC-70]MCW3778462.1 hypothetical protein [Levilactobacillus namurensis]MDT7013439.1 hypothetical protein [Levilactobacillus namurensis]MDT7019751.1 hypothetical protein [Levilactobacillus namurensis]WNN65662.1 hypothetical protein RIN67_00795 [Levilactobacillus namurensis]